MKSPYKANVGDVVLIKDNLPRGTWRIGRIKELIMSRDEQVRSAQVILPNNKTIGRPINLLFPIECPLTDAQEMIQSHHVENITDQGGDSTDSTKPKRTAAREAERRIKELLRDN